MSSLDDKYICIKWMLTKAQRQPYSLLVCVFCLIVTFHALLLGWRRGVLRGIFSTLYISSRRGFILTVFYLCLFLFTFYRSYIPCPPPYIDDTQCWLFVVVYWVFVAFFLSFGRQVGGHAMDFIVSASWATSNVCCVALNFCLTSYSLEIWLCCCSFLSGSLLASFCSPQVRVCIITKIVRLLAGFFADWTTNIPG